MTRDAMGTCGGLARYYIYYRESEYCLGAVLSTSVLEHDDVELYAELWCDCVPAILDRLQERGIRIEIGVPCEAATAASMSYWIKQFLDEEHPFKERDYRIVFHEAAKVVEYSRQVTVCGSGSEE